MQILKKQKQKINHTFDGHKSVGKNVSGFFADERQNKNHAVYNTISTFMSVHPYKCGP